LFSVSLVRKYKATSTKEVQQEVKGGNGKKRGVSSVVLAEIDFRLLEYWGVEKTHRLYTKQAVKVRCIKEA